MPLQIGTTVSSTADAITTSRAADAFVDWRATIAIGIAMIAVIAAIVWIGGELHYSNCLAKAELENPNGFSFAEPKGGSVGRLSPTRLDDRAAAADRCTRVPW